MLAKNRINIFDYTDYQKFLMDFYETEKSMDGTFSYRVFAAAVDMDASLLLKIMQGKRHISSKSIENFIRFFNFKDGKSEYFRELIAYAKAKTDPQIRSHFEKLQKMRPLACRELTEAQYRYFQNWQYPLVRSALDVFVYHGEEDAAALGESCIPKLTATQVTTAVEALVQLGFVRKHRGRYVPAEAHIKTQERWLSASISDYQQNIVELAKQSVVNIPKDLRDISTLTMALDSKQLDGIRKILAETRKSIVKIVNSMPSDECDSVYQLNFQLFPMMRKKDEQ